MTEPVAYIGKHKVFGTEILDRDRPWIDYEITPLYTIEQLYPRVKMTQAEFDELEKSLINAQFDYSELKKTIEIVPDMKWFVRSKEPSNDGSYLFRSGIKDFGDYYYTKDKNENKIAYPFDTKEEAEKWTNPLTEAVQLPVEGE